MKRYLMMLLGFCLLTLAAAEEKKTLKVLMVGNSFSQSVWTYLPAVAKSVPGCELKLMPATIGGCSFKRHIAEWDKAEADPKYKPYGSVKRKTNLQELLKEDKWDIITIQQASPESWRDASYQPYADELIAHIRKYAPQAEIVVQQTWSYNAGDGRINPTNPSWKFGQKEMYDRLTANYRKLAAANKFRIIPTGFAVQCTREESPLQYPKINRKFLESFQWPAALPKTDDVVGNLYWKKEKNGNHKVVADTIHLNRRGEYLQACVWFGFLFNRKTDEIRFVPPEVTSAEAVRLRGCAQKALDTFTVTP